jgi:hypothetical protein
MRGYAFVGLDDDAADSAWEADDGAAMVLSSGYQLIKATGRYDSAQHTASQHAACFAW